MPSLKKLLTLFLCLTCVDPEQRGAAFCFDCINNLVVTVTGSGNQGTSTRTGQGNYTVNGRGYSYGPFTRTNSVQLQGPALPDPAPDAGATAWMGAGTGGNAPPAGQGAALRTVTGNLNAGANGGKSGGPSVPVSLGASHGLAAPPILAPGTPLPYGGWIGPHGASAGMLAGLSQLPNTLVGLVNQSYQDGSQKAQSSKQLNPLTMYAQAAWQVASNNLPAGVEVAQDFWAWLGSFWDSISGVLDTVTIGITARVRSGLGLGWTVDSTSANYQAGTVVGQIINIGLTLFPPASILLFATQFSGALLNTYDAFQRGDVAGGVMGLIGAGVIIGHFVSSCVANQAVSQALTPTLGTSLANAAGAASSWALVGIGFIGAAINVNTAITGFKNGDFFGGLLPLAQGVADAFAASRACFRGRMLIDVPEGKRRAAEIKQGDKVASRNELNPDGPIEYKEVEAVSKQVSPIWNVHLPGQIIETTPEHPFGVKGKGWIPAAMLEIGDLVMTRCGVLLPVEGVADSGEVDTVYNWRIADFHTYFVSATEEGESVWVHNAYATKVNGEQNTYDLQVNYKKGWSASQRAQADGKVAALSNTADKTVVHSPARDGKSQSQFRKTNKLGSTQDADHIHDLQLGGKDTLSNLWPLNSSVNRSLGRQIQIAIAGLPTGAKIRNVTIS